MRARARDWWHRAALAAALGSASQGCSFDPHEGSEEHLGQVQQALDVVGNPGEFDFLLTDDSVFTFWETTSPPVIGPTILLGYPDGASYFTAYVDTDGSVSEFTSSLYDSTHGPGCPTNVSATLELRYTSTGSVIPQDEIDLDGLQARVKFQNSNGSCNTAWFNMPAAGELNTNCPAGQGGSNPFCLEGSGFQVPQLAASACGNQGNCINSAYDLGATSTYLWIRGDTSPRIDAP